MTLNPAQETSTLTVEASPQPGRRRLCVRCGGLMVAEREDFLLLEEAKASPVQWRCVNFGDRTDPIMLANREASRQAEDDQVRVGSGDANS